MNNFGLSFKAWTLSLLLVALALFVAPLQARNLPAPVQETLAKYGLPANSLGIFVQDVTAGKPILVLNADQPYNPASAIKVLTTFIALDVLGPAYTWTTEAYASAPVNNGRLAGDLILKGRGDPFLVIEHFWKFLRDLRHRGLQQVTGDLVIDNSYFAPKPEDPAAFDGKPDHPYNALPDALLFNFQTVNFTFSPDRKTGKVRIVPDPPVTGLQIQNRLKLVNGRCTRRRSLINMQKAGNTLTFTGNYARACGASDLYRVVSDSETLTFDAFKSLWNEMGGTIKGKVRLGKVPKGARRLHTLRSRPLAELISDINKNSINVMTRQLLLTLAAEQRGAPGTVENGVAIIREWLQAHRLDFPGLVIANGAGLSRSARVSARSLGQFLLTAHASPYMPEFFASLPLAGIDGTLRRRFVRESLAGRLRLKTGTINDVKAMAGYVLSRSGRTFVVVALQNHPGVHKGSGTLVQNALLQWVFER